MHWISRLYSARRAWPALAALAVAALALPAYAHRIEKHYPVDGKPVVVLRNANGHVEIKSWSKPEVMVVGDHGSSNVEIDAEQAGQRVEIVTRVLNPSAKPTDLQADFQITVPEETQLQIKTESGNILVDSVHGDMTLETIAADVNLQHVSGFLKVNTAEGTIICTECDGHFEATSVSGNIQLLRPVMSYVQVHTTAGNIFFDGDFVSHGLYY
ncbi:MAG: DUF4097 family beta strand repeat-containing protein, partial [Bryobacteraceae bacterium]